MVFRGTMILAVFTCLKEVRLLRRVRRMGG